MGRPLSSTPGCPGGLFPAGGPGLKQTDMRQHPVAKLLWKGAGVSRQQAQVAQGLQVLGRS